MKINFNNGQIISINEEAQQEQTGAVIEENEPHSVELSINANGKYSGKVKVYAKTPEEALKGACKIASIVETIIREKNQAPGFSKTWQEINGSKKV